MHQEFHKKLLFKVIVSIDKQYSLWLIDREIPPTWRDAGQMQGSAMECLAFIKQTYSWERQSGAGPESNSQSHENLSRRAAYA
jgi:uncharacterized protein YbdZ (MbtH family)